MRITASGAINQPAAPAAEHPAPWEWRDSHWDVLGLFDANGKPLILSGSAVPEALHIYTPRVRALTEMAPDLEAFARDCANGDAGPSDRIAARASELLARIDERSKAGR